MPTQTWVLTPDERALINEVYNANLLDEAGWARFFERVRTSPRREGAIENALLDEGLGDRVRRNLHSIQHGLSDPSVGVDAAVEHFGQHGVVGGLTEIAKSAVTTPIRAGGQVIGGEGLGEKPIETAVGLTGFIPVGRFAGAAVGAGLRRAGTGALGSTATRQAVLNQARQAGAAAARAAQAGGASLDDALREGLRAAQESVTAANPRAANLLSAGGQVGRFTTHPRLTAVSRGIEGADLVAGAEEWPLELIGEGMLEIGATALGRYARSLQDAIANDLSADGPPPDTPPVQPVGALPSGPGPTPEDSQQPSVSVSDQQPTPQQPATPQADSFISEFWQTDDGSPVAPNTTGAKQTLNQTRKYAFGDSADPSTVGTLTVKRVPNNDGKLDNKHWQAWFEGGGVSGVTEASPLSFSAEDNVNSYAEAVDAALTQLPDLLKAQPPQTSREQRTERRQENRERRQQERDWGGLDIDISNEVLDQVEADPNVDPRALLNIKFQELVDNGTITENEAYELRPIVEQYVDEGLAEINERELAEQQQQPQQQQTPVEPAPPADVDEETDDDETMMIDPATEEPVTRNDFIEMAAESAAETTVYTIIQDLSDDPEIDIDEIQRTMDVDYDALDITDDDITNMVYHALSDAFRQGYITEADYHALQEPVLARTREMIPKMVQVYKEAGEAKRAKYKKIEETIPNIKYKKDSQTVRVGEEDKALDGYLIENTDVDTEIFITKIGNNWVAFDPSDMQELAGGYRDSSGPYTKREAAVRAALEKILTTQAQVEAAQPEETPAETPEMTPDEEVEAAEADADAVAAAALPVIKGVESLEALKKIEPGGSELYFRVGEALIEAPYVHFPENLNHATLAAATPEEAVDLYVNRWAYIHDYYKSEFTAEDAEAWRTFFRDNPKLVADMQKSSLEDWAKENDELDREYFAGLERVLADYIVRNFPPESLANATARQKFVVAIVRHLQTTDAPLSESQLIAGYAEATGLSVETITNNQGHLTDMHGYVDEAISETLDKNETQEKGITREMIEARLPTQTQQTPDETPEETPQISGTPTAIADIIEVTGYAEGTTPEKKLQDAIIRYLRSSQSPLTAEQLFAGATAAYGSDKYNSQTVYDVMEVAADTYLASQGLMDVNVDAETAVANIQAIQALEDRLPRQADRTAEREQNQQYSTPYHYSYLVNWVSNLQGNHDIVLEPSAGTGNLAWYAKQIGAEVHVNDIGKVRFRLLKENFTNATNVDATQIDVRLPNVKPTLVVMNPPFSSTQGQKKNTLLGVNMVESALKSLQPGGRLVAIVNGGRDLTDEMKSGEKPGGGPNFDSQQYRKWWARISRNYLIRANVHVSGEVYKGMGTTFNTRLFVIDKPDGENPVPIRDDEGNLKPEFQAMHKQRVDTVTELVEMLQEVRDARRIDAEQERTEPARQTNVEPDRREKPGTPQPDGEPTEPVSTTPDGVRTQPGEPAVLPSEPRDDGAEATGAEDTDTETGVDVAEPLETPPSDTGSDDGGASSVRSDGTPTDAAISRDTGAGRSDRADEIDASSTWVPVPETHIVKGREVKLMETISLATIASPDVSNIDINIPSDFLSLYSEAQQKVIKLIIRAHEGHIDPETVGDTPPRRGFYLGWDTGTGKTWVNAGTIIHNQQQGQKRHIYITQTQDLIGDFKEAFPIAGGDPETLFNINEKKQKNGVLISTYSTLAGKQGDNTRLSEILEFATGMKPPESLMRPQTDVELLTFGELPRTFVLAFNMYNAGAELPTEVQDVMSRFEQHSRATGRSAADAGEAWTDQYQAILEKSDALLKAEGGISPAKWMENAKKFEGVIVFDESHLMKNDKTTKEKDASATARKGKLLAKLLPNARVIYASATGTTEVANLSYMERLGIWGRDKPFANPNQFIIEMQRGGIASQEVVARDLKAKGLFLSYSQDFSDVVVRSMIHELTPEQVQAYNDFANVWQQVRLYLMDYQASIEDLKDEASDGEKVDSSSVGVDWGQFYNQQQRFFQAMLATFKMASVIPDMIQTVEADKKVTMQVVNTYEANQKRQEQRAERTGTDVSAIEITAREILEEYLDEETGALPIFSHEVIVDAENDTKVVRVITNDTKEVMEMPNGTRVPPGAPIPNMDLVAKRDALIDLLYRSNMPTPPIDQVIQAFKERNIEVAEITGRKKRFYFNAAGERVEEGLSPTRTSELARRFNENEIRVLIFSRKGATGANYPATDPNHPIVQYVIDIGWEADKFKQGLGRSKRSNEVAPPEIVTTATNMVGELRFQSTAASRAAEMGATTRGQAQEGTGLDLFTFDAKYLDSEYGKRALFSFLYEMYNGYTFNVPGVTNAKGGPLTIGWFASEGIEPFVRVTGIEVKEDKRTGRLDFYRVSVKQFLNRVLGAPSIAIQNQLYNEFFSRLKSLLDEAEANGTLDTGVETLQTLTAAIQNERTLYTDPDSGAQTYSTTVGIEREPNYVSYDDIQREVNHFQTQEHSVAAFYVRDDGQLFYDAYTASRTDEDGKVIDRIVRISPRGTARYMNVSNAYPEGAGTRHEVAALSVEQVAEFKAQWETELAELPETIKSTVTLVRGLMIDVWDKINPPVYGSGSDVQAELAKRKLVRIVLDNGENLIGRMFTSAEDYREVLESFGIETDTEAITAEKRIVTLSDLRDLLEERWTIELSDGLTIKQRTRAGQPYHAVEGDTNRLTALVEDNVLQRVRPSGGAVTYVLPSGNMATFLDRYAPVSAVIVRGNQVNRIDLEYNTGGQQDAGPEDDTPPDTTPEGGGTTPDVPPVDSTPDENVQADADTSQTQRSTGDRVLPSRQEDTPTRSRQTDEPAPETPDETPEPTGMTDEQKIEMAIDKISGWVKAEIQKGTDEIVALDTLTKNSIWHGSELYALETFAGQSPEQVRDYFRKEIVNRINRERMRTGGRGMVLMAQPAPVAAQEQTTPAPQFNVVDGDSIRVDTQAVLDYLQTAEIGEPREIETDSPYIKHGILEFPIGEYGTARVSKPDPEHPFIKNETVYFQLDYTGAGGNDPDIKSYPIQSHLFSRQTIRPERFIDAARQQKLTLEKVEKALSDDPDEITGVGRVTAGIEEATPQETPNVQVDSDSTPDPGADTEVQSNAIAMQSTVAESREAGDAIAQEAQVYEDRGSELKNITGEGFNQTSRRKILHIDRGYGEQMSDILFYVQSPETKDANAVWKINVRNRAEKTSIAIIDVPRQGGIRPKQQVIKTAEDAILKLMQAVKAQLQETPDATEDISQAGGTEETRIPAPDPQPADDATHTPADTVPRSEEPAPDAATDFTYHGATFTEENGTLSITGDAIPESFWDYYHSGGRGRNSAHKRAMKEAGWNYTFRGKPRIYTFSISITDFNRWKASHPDDGSEAVDLAEQGTPEQLAFMENLRQATIEVVITDPGSPWRDNSHHFVFEGVDGVRASVSRERDHRRNARKYLKDSYEVTLYGDAIHNISRSIAWSDMDGIDEDNFSDHDNKKDAIIAMLNSIEAAHLDLKPKPEEVPVTPDADEDQLFSGILEKMEAGQFTRDGNEYIVEVDELGKVGVYFSTAKVSSLMPGQSTEETIETKISFSSKESPQTFKYLSIDVPEEVVRHFNNRFENEHLAEIRDTNNWEQLGRKHAFKHKLNNATARVSKHWSGKYEVVFDNLPKMGVTYVLIEGANLTERFHNGLAELQPYMFTDEVTKQGQVLDTLRVKTGKETSFESNNQEVDSTIPDEADQQSTGDVPPTENSLTVDQDTRDEIFEALTTNNAEPVAGEVGVYESKVHLSETGESVTRFTVSRRPIYTQPGLFGHDEPVLGDRGMNVHITSDLITNALDIQVDLNEIDEYLKHSDTDPEYFDELLENDPNAAAVDMALYQITPDMIDLRLESALALSELGMMEIGQWEQLTPAQQTTALNQITTQLYETSADNALTKTQTDAINLLQDRANKWEREQFKSVSGGAPLTVTLETVLQVPDIPPADLKNTKRLIHPGTRLTEKLDGNLTPKMRLWMERSRREYLSGYKNLDTLGPVGNALRAAAEYVLDIQDRGSVVDLRQLQPHQKALTDLVNARASKREARDVVHGDLSAAIFRYIHEDSSPIDDPELQKIADGWKEAWRGILKNHILHMLQLRSEVASLEGDERVVIRRADGSGARDWVPDQLPGHEWIDEAGKYKRESDGQMLTVEQAIDEADLLYLPHQYPKSHWNAVMDQVNVKKVIKQLDAAADNPKTKKLPGFDYDKNSGTWTFTRTGNTYTDKAEAIRAAKDYWTSQYALAQEMLAQKENSVIGRYGHLELERETTDKLYLRDVSNLLDHVQLFWRRVGEIAAWGQYDPVLGNWPRLAKYIARIGETALDAREDALKRIASTLMESESGMFEKLPSFREGEATAVQIMQHWNTPNLEKMRAENPEKFNDAVMQTLVDHGVAVRDGNTYRLKGKDDAAERATFIRHMVPYFQTIDLREETVLKIVRGIGHWQPVDRQNSNADKVWYGINHLTTTMTLGLGTSFQNMAEVPLLASIAGGKATTAGLTRLTNDAEFRKMLPNLGAALSKARDYLSDTNTQSKYLTFTLFTATEKWSRLAGVAVGWEAAKHAIANYLSDPSVTNRKRLEELNISVKTIDDYRSVLQVPGEAPNFDALVREAEARVLEGAMMVSGLRKHDAEPPSNMHVDRVGDEMARAARYVSIRVFKGYNPLSLPNFLTKQDPIIRTFFKFKSWSAQMHQYMWEMFGRAQREARQGNWGPAWRLGQGFAFMGVSAGVLAAFFRFMAGTEDDDDNRILQAIAMNQTLGIASMIMELAMYADGNPYKASQLISSTFGSPTAGVVARVGSNLLAGEPGEAASTTFWQLPGVREARRFGGGAIPVLRRGE